MLYVLIELENKIKYLTLITNKPSKSVTTMPPNSKLLSPRAFALSDWLVVPSYNRHYYNAA